MTVGMPGRMAIRGTYSCGTPPKISVLLTRAVVIGHEVIFPRRRKKRVYGTPKSNSVKMKKVQPNESIPRKVGPLKKLAIDTALDTPPVNHRRRATAHFCRTEVSK
jgi:hypothetical protein